MNHEHDSNDAEFLPPPIDSAVQAVLTEVLPEDAIERVMLRARGLANAPTTLPQRVQERPKGRRRAASLLLGGVAAAAALLFIATVIVDGQSRTAFAEIIAKIRAARTVQFRTTTQLGGGRIVEGQMFLEGNHLRLEQFNGMLVQSADFDTRQAVFLDMHRKVAQSVAIDANVARIFAHPIDQLRSAKSSDAEPIGQELLNGRRTELYRLRQVNLLGITGDCQMMVWVDIESELPAKIVIRGTDPKAEMELRFDTFVWNAPLDQALFALNVPAGFVEGTVVMTPGRQQPTDPATPKSKSAPAFVKGVLHDRVPVRILWDRAGESITALMRDPESVPPLERQPNELRRWDVTSGELLWSEKVAGASWVAASEDRKFLATVIGRELQLRDAASGNVVRKWTTNAPLSPLAFSPDSKTLAAGITEWGPFGGRGGQTSGGVQIWDSEQGSLIRSISDEKPVTFVGYSADGRTLASSSNDGPVKLWDAATGELNRVFPGRGQTAFSSDGKSIACISSPQGNARIGRVDVYRLSDGSLARSLASEAGASDSWILSVAFSPDGHLLAAADWNGTATVWEVATGGRKRTISESKSGVLSVEFSPDSATLAIGSEDRTLCLVKVVAD